MALLSQVDEPTFNELSKRFHRRMTKHHGLAMPLGTFRETLIQAVGYRSLHDARQAWRQALPEFPDGADDHEDSSLPLPDAPKERDARQEAWRLARLDGGAPLVAWSRAHPGMLAALDTPNPFVWELVDSGDRKGMLAYQALAEAGQFVPSSRDVLAMVHWRKRWDSQWEADVVQTIDWFVEHLPAGERPAVVQAMAQQLAQRWAGNLYDNNEKLDHLPSLAFERFLQRLLSEQPDREALSQGVSPYVLMDLGHTDLALQRLGGAAGKKPSLGGVRAAIHHGVLRDLLEAVPRSHAWEWLSLAATIANHDGRPDALAVVVAQVRARQGRDEDPRSHRYWIDTLHTFLGRDTPLPGADALVEGRDAWVRQLFQLSDPHHGRTLLNSLLHHPTPWSWLDRLVPDLDRAVSADAWRARRRQLSLVLLQRTHRQFLDRKDQAVHSVKSPEDPRSVAYLETVDWLLKKGADPCMEVGNGSWGYDTDRQVRDDRSVFHEHARHSAFSLWLHLSHYRLDWAACMVERGLDLGARVARLDNGVACEPVVAGLFSRDICLSDLPAWQALGAPPLAGSACRGEVLGALFRQDDWWFEGASPRLTPERGAGAVRAFLEAQGLMDPEGLASAWRYVLYPEQMPVWRALSDSLPTPQDVAWWIQAEASREGKRERGQDPHHPWRPSGAVGGEDWAGLAVEGWQGREAPPLPHRLTQQVAQAAVWGVDVTARLGDGETLLHWAGTLPEGRGGLGEEPDREACTIIRGLLKAGCSPLQADAQGRVPWEWVLLHDGSDPRKRLLNPEGRFKANGIAHFRASPTPELP